MRSETIKFMSMALRNFGNTEVYSLHDLEWRNVTVSMKDCFYKGDPIIYKDFDNVILAVHKSLLDRDTRKFFLVETVYKDWASGQSRLLREAGLDHFFVFDIFLTSLDTLRLAGRYGLKEDEASRLKRFSKANEEDYFERGYSRARQPSVTHIAFKTEEDAIAARAILDLLADTSDDFARAS